MKSQQKAKGLKSNKSFTSQLKWIKKSSLNLGEILNREHEQKHEMTEGFPSPSYLQTSLLCRTTPKQMRKGQ